MIPMQMVTLVAKERVADLRRAADAAHTERPPGARDGRPRPVRTNQAHRWAPVGRSVARLLRRWGLLMPPSPRQAVSGR